MSIIAEALKKAEKERDKVINSKEYMSKILGPQSDVSLCKKEAPEDTPVVNADRRPSRSLAISGILIIGAIVFLSAINMLIISAPDAERAALTAPAKTPMSGLEAEAYTGTVAKCLKRQNLEYLPRREGFQNFPEKAISQQSHTTTMQPDIKLVERGTGIMDRVGKVLTGTTMNDEFSSNFTLNGIIYDADNSWAIINNKMVKVGDMLDGAKVLAILPQKAVLIFKNKTFDLNVK